MLNRLIRGVGALIVLVALLVGAPLVLLAWVGNPWPAGGWSEVQLLTNRTILGALAVVGWLAWAQTAACILIELAGAVRGKAPQRVRFASGGQQQFARVLVTSVIALALGGGMGASTVGPSLAATTAQPETAPTTSHTVERRDGDQVAPGPTVTIDRDTTVWRLAEVHLDDGSRWRELLDLNRGEALSDGTALTQATQTVPTGSTLRLPASAHANKAPASQPGEKDHQDRQDGSYTVKPNDTLWDIAETKLDDPARYMELYEASTGTLQPGGDHLVDPDHIEVGWKITIPGGRTARDGDRGHQGGEGNQGDHQADEQGDEQTPDTPDVGPEDKGDQAEGGSEADTTEEQSPDAENAENQSADEAGDAESDESVLDADWVLPGLTGGGVLLAGALYLGLQCRRRAQLRARRPGRAIAAPPAELAPTEMTISAAGGPVAATVAFMDEALRRLAEHARTHRAEMPPLGAVQLREDLVILHLSGPADLPAPWEGSPDRLHWSCSTAAAVEDLGPDHGWAEAPYPMLVTIGVDDRRDAAAAPPVGDSDHRSEHQGDLWLLNCEELGTLEVVGDPTRAGDFARHLAAQLAVNPWSHQASVDCVGIAQETEGLGDRIRYYDAGWEGDRAASEVLAEAVSMVDRATSHDTDVSTGRTGGLDDDVWPARMLLVATEVTTGGDVESGALLELRHLVATHVGRTGTAIVVTATSPGSQDTAGGTVVPSGEGQTVTTVVEVTGAGRVLLSDQGLDLAAVGLSSEEARGCALLYAHSEILDDVAVPVDEEATEGWEAMVDQTGALRRELTLPRSTPEEDLAEPVTSLLAGTDEDYVTTAPVVSEDLDAIAPKVPESVLAQVKAEDPALDADLADWFDPRCPRPKLTLLGPVAVRTHGRPLAKYKALCTEIVAYLALRPRNGATRDELAEAMGWDDPARVRKYIDLVRHWLGEDPATHEHYLPHANKSPAAKSRGMNVYQVTTGLLTDWGLFRRLRARGTHSDLLQALELVTGRPFDQLRQGGWSWLYQGDPHDQHAAHAIADVAFTVVTHCLHEGDLVRARAAAEVAMLAVPDEQVVQLCQVALTEAEGNNTDAMRILLEDVCNPSEDGDGPLDLPERTQEIIRNHQWMAS